MALPPHFVSATIDARVLSRRLVASILPIIALALLVGLPAGAQAQTVANVRPESGAPGTSARIYGSGFDGSTTATIGGTAATVNSVSANGNVLYVTVPSGPRGTSRVTVDFGGTTKTLADAFDVVSGGPGTFFPVDAGLTVVKNSSSDWGDYDGDGDLDLVITGEDESQNFIAKVYRNDGGGTFTDIGVELTDAVRGSVDWGDFDSDGDLDLVVTGTTIYTNIGDADSDGFTEFNSFASGLMKGKYGSCAWGDFDGGGTLDLVVTGEDESGTRQTALYSIKKLDNSFRITKIDAGLTGVSSSSSDWGDYDGDGDLDLVITGRDRSGTRKVTIYRNDGRNADGTSEFTAIDAGLLGGNSADWGDYDGDGDLDLVVTGQNEFGNGTGDVYRNDGDTDGDGLTDFTNVSSLLTDVINGSSDWGDFDGDGDLDLVITGFNANNNDNEDNKATTTIYRNDGDTDNDGLTEFPKLDAGLTGVENGSSDWGDYDGDGDLDLLVTGLNRVFGSSNSRIARIYENVAAPSITQVRPQSGAPGTTVRVYGSSFDGNTTVTIGGSAATVTNVSASGSVLYATVPSGPSSTSSVTADFGGTTKTLGGAFDVVTGGSGSFTSIGAGVTGVKSGSSDWGDYDGDGDADLVVTGENDSGGEVATVYRNDGDTDGDGFTEFTDIKAGLTGVRIGTSDWGDYDGDGDLDLFVTGSDGSNGQFAIYRNDGDTDDDGLTDFTAIDAGPTYGYRRGSSDWGDFDGDGDLDLVVTGRESVDLAAAAVIYRNDGDTDDDGVTDFTTIDAGLEGVFTGSSDWGDVDGDGDLDLVITGDPFTPKATIYRNDGDIDGDGLTDFTDIGAGLTSVSSSSSDWGDVDGDGRLDLVVTGESDSDGKTATIYHNDGDTDGDGATDFTALDAGLTGVDSGSSGWGDFDGDGRLDLVVTGVDGSDVRTATIYRNDGDTDGDGLTDVTAVGTGGTGLAEVGSSSSDWGDLNGDGRLDLVITGQNSSGAPTTALYGNQAGNPIPVEMATLEGVQTDRGVLLEWTTASETNNAGFRIQRRLSDEEGAWTKVGSVDGAGTTSQAQSYRFTDTGLPYEADSLSYRLKQVDTDGSTSFSETVTVERGVTEVQLLGTYPNPAHQQATVRYALPEKQETAIRLYDVLGRRVRTVISEKKEGRHTLTLDVGDLSSGVYVLRLRSGGTVKTRKLTVVK